jgi:hypothetical protein
MKAKEQLTQINTDEHSEIETWLSPSLREKRKKKIMKKKK